MSVREAQQSEILEKLLTVRDKVRRDQTQMRALVDENRSLRAKLQKQTETIEQLRQMAIRANDGDERAVEDGASSAAPANDGDEGPVEDRPPAAAAPLRERVVYVRAAGPGRCSVGSAISLLAKGIAIVGTGGMAAAPIMQDWAMRRTVENNS